MITAFRIVAITFILLGLIIAVIILRFLAKALKKQNKSFMARARDVRQQMASTVVEMDEAQGQIEAVAIATKGVRKGMDQALASSEAAVNFLESRAFQVGVPVALWFLFLVIAVPRGRIMVRAAAKSRPKRVIPPPSWEAAAEEAE